jgi:hypothetical protein
MHNIVFSDASKIHIYAARVYTQYLVDCQIFYIIIIWYIISEIIFLAHDLRENYKLTVNIFFSFQKYSCVSY